MAVVLTDNQNYTNIAAAIRTKLGNSNTYLPSAMAAAINSIQTGGGGSLPAGINAIVSGTITPTSQLSSLTIQHNLGILPRAIIIYDITDGTPATSYNQLCFFVLRHGFNGVDKYTGLYTRTQPNSSNGIYTFLTQDSPTYCTTWDSESIVAISGFSKWLTNKTYRWVVIG